MDPGQFKGLFVIVNSHELCKLYATNSLINKIILPEILTGFCKLLIGDEASRLRSLANDSYLISLSLSLSLFLSKTCTITVAHEQEMKTFRRVWAKNTFSDRACRWPKTRSFKERFSIPRLRQMAYSRLLLLPLLLTCPFL